MNYHVVLFEKPESIDYSGPIKFRISKDSFERACSDAVNVIQYGEDVYRMDDKKRFSIEDFSGKTTDSILVCEAHKLKQP